MSFQTHAFKSGSAKGPKPTDYNMITDLLDTLITSMNNDSQLAAKPNDSSSTKPDELLPTSTNSYQNECMPEFERNNKNNLVNHKQAARNVDNNNDSPVLSNFPKHKKSVHMRPKKFSADHFEPSLSKTLGKSNNAQISAKGSPAKIRVVCNENGKFVTKNLSGLISNPDIPKIITTIKTPRGSNKNRNEVQTSRHPSVSTIKTRNPSFLKSTTGSFLSNSTNQVNNTRNVSGSISKTKHIKNKSFLYHHLKELDDKRFQKNIRPRSHEFKSHKNSQYFVKNKKPMDVIDDDVIDVRNLVVPLPFMKSYNKPMVKKIITDHHNVKVTDRSKIHMNQRISEYITVENVQICTRTPFNSPADGMERPNRKIILNKSVSKESNIQIPSNRRSISNKPISRQSDVTKSSSRRSFSVRPLSAQINIEKSSVSKHNISRRSSICDTKKRDSNEDINRLMRIVQESKSQIEQYFQNKEKFTEEIKRAQDNRNKFKNNNKTEFSRSTTNLSRLRHSAHVLCPKNSKTINRPVSVQQKSSNFSRGTSTSKYVHPSQIAQNKMQTSNQRIMNFNMKPDCPVKSKPLSSISNGKNKIIPNRNLYLKNYKGKENSLYNLPKEKITGVISKIFSNIGKSKNHSIEKVKKNDSKITLMRKKLEVKQQSKINIVKENNEFNHSRSQLLKKQKMISKKQLLIKNPLNNSKKKVIDSIKDSKKLENVSIISQKSDKKTLENKTNIQVNKDLALVKNTTPVKKESKMSSKVIKSKLNVQDSLTIEEVLLKLYSTIKIQNLNVMSRPSVNIIKEKIEEIHKTIREENNAKTSIHKINKKASTHNKNIQGTKSTKSNISNKRHSHNNVASSKVVSQNSALGTNNNNNSISPKTSPSHNKNIRNNNNIIPVAPNSAPKRKTVYSKPTTPNNNNNVIPAKPSSITYSQVSTNTPSKPSSVNNYKRTNNYNGGNLVISGKAYKLNVLPNKNNKSLPTPKDFNKYVIKTKKHDNLPTPNTNIVLATKPINPPDKNVNIVSCIQTISKDNNNDKTLKTIPEKPDTILLTKPPTPNSNNIVIPVKPFKPNIPLDKNYNVPLFKLTIPNNNKNGNDNIVKLSTHKDYIKGAIEATTTTLMSTLEKNNNLISSKQTTPNTNNIAILPKLKPINSPDKNDKVPTFKLATVNNNKSEKDSIVTISSANDNINAVIQATILSVKNTIEKNIYSVPSKQPNPNTYKISIVPKLKLNNSPDKNNNVILSSPSTPKNSNYNVIQTSSLTNTLEKPDDLVPAKTSTPNTTTTIIEIPDKPKSNISTDKNDNVLHKPIIPNDNINNVMQAQNSTQKNTLEKIDNLISTKSSIPNSNYILVPEKPSKPDINDNVPSFNIATPNNNKKENDNDNIVKSSAPENKSTISNKIAKKENNENVIIANPSIAEINYNLIVGKPIIPKNNEIAVEPAKPNNNNNEGNNNNVISLKVSPTNNKGNNNDVTLGKLVQNYNNKENNKIVLSELSSPNNTIQIQPKKATSANANKVKINDVQQSKLCTTTEPRAKNIKQNNTTENNEKLLKCVAPEKPLTINKENTTKSNNNIKDNIKDNNEQIKNYNAHNKKNNNMIKMLSKFPSRTPSAHTTKSRNSIYKNGSSATLRSYAASNTGIIFAPFSNKKLISLTPTEIVQDYVNLVSKAKKEGKTFTVCGNYYSIRQAFEQRGWVEKMRINLIDDKDSLRKLETLSNFELVEGIKDKENGEKYQKIFISKLLAGHQVDFYWDYMTNPFSVNNDKIKRTVINRFPYGSTRSYTSKAGLCESLKEASWYYIEGYSNIQFPRTYNLAVEDELESFVQDYRRTSVVSLLLWILRHADKPQSIISPIGQIPTSIFNFATLQCYNHIKVKEHKDLEQIIPVARDYEWDIFLEKFYKIIHQGQHFKETEFINAVLIIDQTKYILDKLRKFDPNIDYDGHMNLWLLKPSNGSRGCGIHVCRTLKYALDTIDCRKETRYVIQKYIERPLLIHSTKFDIRQWFLVTCMPNLHVWLYKDCYLRFSSQLFDLSKLHESIHLTNNSIQCRYKNNIQRNTSLPEQNMWHSDTFRKYLSDNGQPYVWRNIIYKGIKECLVGLFMLCQDKLQTRVNSFELCGADFMLREDYRPYLIEINSRPALYPSTRITAKMCPKVLEDVIRVTVDYARNPRCSTGSFELIYTDDYNYVPPINVNSLYIQGISYIRYASSAPGKYICVNPLEQITLNELKEDAGNSIKKVLKIDANKVRKDVKNTLEKILAIIHSEQKQPPDEQSNEKNKQFRIMLSEFVDIISCVKNKNA